MKGPEVYEQLQRDVLEGRELEAAVLTRATQKLNRCAKNWARRGSPEFKHQLDEALLYNQKLWSFLQVELINPSHPLPESVRVNLIRLSGFIDQKTFSLFAEGTLADLEAIARINQTIVAGLLAGVRNAASSAPPAAASDEPHELNLSA